MKKFFIVHNDFTDTFKKESWEILMFERYEDAELMWKKHNLKWWSICIEVG